MRSVLRSILCGIIDVFRVALAIVTPSASLISSSIQQHSQYVKLRTCELFLSVLFSFHGSRPAAILAAHLTREFCKLFYL